MISLLGAHIYKGGKLIKADTKPENVCNTLAYSILSTHNTSGTDKMKIKFDALASHDITYVGIIQTARASGLDKFPIPYVLTNCHNSLCAVGGTINEDDHVFGLSAAKKYGGIFVPPHIAVIHQYMRECFAAPGKMILGSDSHTRYGALGCMAIGEGGPELVKQLLSKTYDIDAPEVVGVHLTGRVNHGVGPQDVALALIGAVFANGFVKNKVLEFFGNGISALSMDFRMGIDVMTTETTCLSSIWETDEKTRKYLDAHGRVSEYKQLTVADGTYYESVIDIDLSTIEPMIALPFHPSNVYTIKELQSNAHDIFADCEEKAKKIFSESKIAFSLTDKLVAGNVYVNQGVIAGCAGGSFENLYAAASILKDKSVGSGEFALSVYPSSQPVFFASTKNGLTDTFLRCGAVVRSAFCGPCFGAGDVPANNGLSIRHSTRNFPNREGSKPGEGQIASVALMDARSIAATAANKGILTSAADVDYSEFSGEYKYDKAIYESRVYNGYGKANASELLKYGPNIADWPAMPALTDDLLLKVAALITDPVTTTDELIPSGETSSYRSNPFRLAEFALSRKVPGYVAAAKNIQKAEKARENGKSPVDAVPELEKVYKALAENGINASESLTGIGSVVYAVKPGDGSAREQAASCQKVLGTWANIACEYATKRYRSNLINWGMLPFLLEGEAPFSVGDYIFIKDAAKAVKECMSEVKAYVVGDTVKEITLKLADMTADERKIILKGCLTNFYKD